MQNNIGFMGKDLIRRFRENGVTSIRSLAPCIRAVAPTIRSPIMRKESTRPRSTGQPVQWRTGRARSKRWALVWTPFFDRKVPLGAAFCNNVRNLLPHLDLLVNAVKWPPGAERHIVTRDMRKIMKRGAFIVDISCDRAGAIETSVPTPLDDPVYEAEGIRHFCVANLPSAVSRTSSYVPSNHSLPYVVKIADKGWLGAIKEDSTLRRGLGFALGHLTFKPTAEAQNRPYTAPEEIIEMFDR